ncbi:MAG: hypothetical protein AAGF88_07555 [Pseudomonadota bacterium]
MAERPFFIGFAAVPVGLRMFLMFVAAALIGLFAGVSIVAGSAQDDPGDAAFRFDLGRQTVTGILEVTPYPILHVTEGSDAIAAGTTIMLSGQGKNGVLERGAPLAGQEVVASGVLLTRGDLQMIQLRGGRNGLAAADPAQAVPPPAPLTESLGRWRLAGEICDGKCAAGAMRPGTGLSHRACAEVCLVGGIPPVFISAAPIDGEEFLLITGPGGTELPDAAYDHIASYVSIEGEVTRRGTLLVIEIDPASLERVE